eukprot:TRINITY_DN4048_c6_g1_i1.p2 TRINITY_DN4048_c6_g1~~TRINITY_DN4048_c6_g1_i1.p2  ORF type:complete len:194 (+),score=62.20 TRINITY_DN4048_c6_g1_i1:361-942(+)
MLSCRQAAGGAYPGRPAPAPLGSCVVGGVHPAEMTPPGRCDRLLMGGDESSSSDGGASPGPSMSSSFGSDERKLDTDSDEGRSVSSPGNSPQATAAKLSAFRHKKRPVLPALTAAGAARVNPFEPSSIRKVRSCEVFFDRQDSAELAQADGDDERPQEPSPPAAPTRHPRPILKGSRSGPHRVRSLAWSADVR